MEFQAWPKISRLNSPYILTEKIDGTNACVVVEEDGHGFRSVGAQSRTRIITPENDNYGFATWVYTHANLLGETLGPGYHYGEWYGSGIQRRYGLDQKYFALFNVERWAGFNEGGPLYDIGVRHVPVLAEGEEFSLVPIMKAVDDLRSNGSRVNKQFDRPEGIVIHFKHNRTNFKYILDK